MLNIFTSLKRNNLQRKTYQCERGLGEAGNMTNVVSPETLQASLQSFPSMTHSLVTKK